MANSSCFIVMTRRGFTLIELLVVIGISAVLMGLLLSAVQKVRESAARASCQNQLKQLALGLTQYHNDHGRFPLGWGQGRGSLPMYASGWGLHLLPYIEQSEILTRAIEDYQNQQKPWWTNHGGLSTPIPTFQCPSDSRVERAQITKWHKITVAHTSYLGVSGTTNAGRDGVLVSLDPEGFLGGVSFSSILDGTTNTIMLGERPPSVDLEYGWWYAGHGFDGFGGADMIMGVREILPRFGSNTGSCPPGPYTFQSTTFLDPCGHFHYWSPHSNGANFAFADGSVKFLTYGMESLLPALSTRAGGEVASLD